jgi:glucosylceramidase
VAVETLTAPGASNVDHPIVADLTSMTYSFNPHCYYMAHFSKFIRPEGHRIGSSSNVDGLQVTAGRNVNNSRVVVAMNPTDGEIAFEITRDRLTTSSSVPSYGVATFVY